MTASVVTGMVPRVNACVPSKFDIDTLDPAQQAFTEAMCTEHPMTPLAWEDLLWITTPHSLLTREPLGSLMLTQAFRPTIDSALMSPTGRPEDIQQRLTTRVRQRLSRIHNQPQALLDRWLDDFFELLYAERLSEDQWKAIAHQVDLFGFSLRHYIELLDLPTWKALLDGLAPRTMPVSESIEKSQLMFKGLLPQQQADIEWVQRFAEVERRGTISKPSIPSPTLTSDSADYADFLGSYRSGLVKLHRAVLTS